MDDAHFRFLFASAVRAPMPGTKEPATSRCCANSAAERVCSREGFCPSPHVLAAVLTAPNPTAYASKILHLDRDGCAAGDFSGEKDAILRLT